MEDMNDSEISLAWLWVIEAMASYKEVNLSLLRDLVQAAPELPCGLAKNAKERIALRCLEDLSARQNGTTSDVRSAPGSKVEFDFSESCQDALQRIVQETSESDLKVGGPELEKWDIKPFIRHKRANMPKLALEKISESIVNGTHPRADFLREKCGLVSTSQDNGVPMNNDNCNSVTSSPNLICPEDENTLVKVISDQLIMENGDKQFEGNLHNGDVLPSKRGRSDSDAENRTVLTENCDGKDNSDVQNDNLKKAKQYASLANQAVEQIPVPLCGREQQEGSPERNASVTTRGIDLAGSKMGIAEEGRILEDGCDDCTVLKRSDDRQKLIAAEAHEKTDVCHEAEISSDSDGYHNERTDVANKKHEFLSSQLTDSLDSKMADSSEQNLCMKCNEAGQVLVCNSNNCQLVVHEKCIDSSAIFDDKGNFYCPFCAYSLAITEYLKAKKRSSLSRKELSAFICMGSVEHQPKKSGDGSDKKKNHCTSGSKDGKFLGKNHQNDKLEERGEKEGNQVAGDVKEDNIIVNNQQAELSETRDINANLECEEKRTSINGVALRALADEKEVEEKVVEECPSPRRSEGQKTEAPGTCDNLSGANTDMDYVNQGKEDLGMRPRVIRKQDIDAPIEPVHEFNIDSEGNSEGDDDESTISNYCIRVRNKEVHYNTYPAIPQSRRKKVPWTAEEEQKLKEGMQLYSDGRNFPWKKILEFGDGVFLKGRTTVDLKDKWRNMCKGSPRPK